VSWRQQCVFGRFTWSERLWLFAVFDGVVSLESNLQIVVNQQTDIHGILVLNLTNEIHQFWLH